MKRSERLKNRIAQLDSDIVSQEERISHLEELLNEKTEALENIGSRILHPIEYSREQKEIKKIRTAIATVSAKRNAALQQRKDAERQAASAQRTEELISKHWKKAIVVIAVFILLPIIVVSISSLSKRSEKKNSVRTVPETVFAVAATDAPPAVLETQTKTVARPETTQPSTKKSGTTIATTTSVEATSEQLETTVPPKEKQTTEAERSKQVSNESETEDAEPSFINCSAEDLSVSTTTDYAHMSNDIVHMGNNEGATITITVNNPKITYDDLVIDYESDALDVRYNEPHKAGNTTTLKLYITGKKPGTTELYIVTKYDLWEYGEDADGYIISIMKMDQSDGRVAYVTPTGEKYHFSERCAGENAIKTTYRDAVNSDYDPCKKCAG